MPDPEDYKFCNNELEVNAGDRYSYRTSTNWNPFTWQSDRMCTFDSCWGSDVQEWYLATKAYFRDDFAPHFERFKTAIAASGQAVPVGIQREIIKEADTLIAQWLEYMKWYRNKWGVDEATGIAEGPYGYAWVSEDTRYEWVKGIVDFFDKAACLRDKFNDHRPEGKAKEVPDYGVAQVPTGTREPAAAGGMDPLMMVAIGLGGWVVIKALSE